MNNADLKKYISQERVWLSEIRMELNKLLDKYLSRIDGLENKILKEEEQGQKSSQEDVPPYDNCRITDEQLGDNKGTPERD